VLGHQNGFWSVVHFAPGKKSARRYYGCTEKVPVAEIVWYYESMLNNFWN